MSLSPSTPSSWKHIHNAQPSSGTNPNGSVLMIFVESYNALLCTIFLFVMVYLRNKFAQFVEDKFSFGLL